VETGHCTNFLVPCACAIAVAIKLGHVPNKFPVDNCHRSYSLCPDVLQGITGRLRTVLAPTSQELKTV
jgi:hypothetical protein